MAKDREEFQHDWYAILGCEVGSAVEIIQKAARKLAIKYHPDKTNDPTAPEKFLLIQKAKDVLSDETRKKVIDDHFIQIKQREQYDKERSKVMDERRKRFRDDLEQRVAQAHHDSKKARTGYSHEDILTHELAKNSKVLAAMRKDNESIIQQAREEARRRQEQKNKDFAAYSRQLASEIGSTGNLQCAIKVKWRKSIGETVSYERLRLMFGGFGVIEDIALDQTKKSTAVFYFTTGQAARAAIDAFATNDDFRVSFLHSAGSVSPTTNSSSHTIFTSSSSVNDVLQEEVTNMKRTAEREFLRNPFRASTFSSTANETTSDPSLPTETPQQGSLPPDAPSGESLAAKENSVLKKMLEAAAAKKK
jgi:curved DNA-binding protein CbpA